MNWRRLLEISAIASALVTVFAVRDAAAYRTATDGAQLHDKGRVAWSDPAMPFVVSSRDLPPGISVTDVERALAEARAAWAGVSCTRVDPHYAGDSTDPAQPMDGINTISWVKDWAAHGFPAKSAGSTDVQYLKTDGQWHIAEADIYLNLEQEWSIRGTNTVRDVQAVLTHELGHALGMLHSCETDGSDGAPVCSSGTFAGDAMYPLYELSESKLSDDDAAGICYLYPKDGCDACAPNELCVDNQCVSKCMGDPCQPGEVCGVWGCTPSGGCFVADCTDAACTSDSQCGPLNSCVDGRCARGKAILTEACNSSRDCESGVCVAGRCSSECVSSDECETGTCDTASESLVAGCYDKTQGTMGDPCARGEECASGLCVRRDGAGTCTIACDPGVCPHGQQCSLVDGQHVCEAPGPVTARGSCSVALGRPQEGLLFAFGALLASAALRRRKKRY